MPAIERPDPGRWVEVTVLSRGDELPDLAAAWFGDHLTAPD